MSWRNALRPASWRGVSFHVDGSDGSGGRRAVVHEYPGRDLPYVEDLGRQARRISVTAYVIGPDYMAARDAVIAACEEPGAGTLVHPWWGELTVACAGYRIGERGAEGGLARIEIEFIEAGDRVFPTAVIDTGRRVGVAAAALVAACRVDFVGRFSLIGRPAFVFDAASDLVRRFADVLDELKIAIPHVRDGVTGSLIEDALRPLSDPTLVQTTELALRLTDAIGIYRRAADPAGALVLLDRLHRFGDTVPAIDPTTPARRAVAANQAAIVDLIAWSALAAMAEAAAVVPLASQPEAAAIRRHLIEAIDEASIASGDKGADAVFAALSALASAVTQDLTRRGADLATVRSYAMPRCMPSLVLAHRLYQDAGRADDLARRNRVRHPAFMPETGEALSR